MKKNAMLIDFRNDDGSTVMQAADPSPGSRFGAVFAQFFYGPGEGFETRDEAVAYAHSAFNVVSWDAEPQATTPSP